MFGLFKLFFGSDEPDSRFAKNAANAVSSLDVKSEMVGHENWKLRLKLYLDGQSSEKFTPEVVCHDNRCHLGQWIHGPGQEAMGKFPGFSALMRHHQMFHYVASNVVALDEAGKKVEARHMLNTQFQEYSDSVVQDLKILAAIAEYAGNK